MPSKSDFQLSLFALGEKGHDEDGSDNREKGTYHVAEPTDIEEAISNNLILRRKEIQ